MLSQAVVQALIAVGRAGQPDVPDMLVDPASAWQLLMVGDRPWQRAARELDDENLMNLIRGLLLFAQATDWSGGSVSPVIPMYREYLNRQPPSEPMFTSWIVDNRRNGYEPFGTVVHGGARTLAEFHAYQDARRVRAAEGMARDAERQHTDGHAKAGRATARIPAAVRRGDVAALQALLRAGGNLRLALPDGQSLIELARANDRTAMVAFLEGFGATSDQADPDRSPG